MNYGEKREFSKENNTGMCRRDCCTLHKTFACRRTRSPALASKTLITSITRYQSGPRPWRTIIGPCEKASAPVLRVASVSKLRSFTDTLYGTDCGLERAQTAAPVEANGASGD